MFVFPFDLKRAEPTSSLISPHTDENSSETTAFCSIMSTVICSSHTARPSCSHTTWGAGSGVKPINHIGDPQFTFTFLHLWLWVTSRYVQEPTCLCHLVAPPDQHHLMVLCTQDGTHAKRLSQKSPRVSKLGLSHLTQLWHSLGPVGPQIVLVAGETKSQGEGGLRLFIYWLLGSFPLVLTFVGFIQTPQRRVVQRIPSREILPPVCPTVRFTVLLTLCL